MQTDTKIRVMSFNIRSGVTIDGINNFENRASLVRELLENEKPDLIGFQEIVDMTLDFLFENYAKDYLLLGCGRDADCKGERCMIAVRRDRFELLSFETLWLSDTPNIAGSRLENCGQSRHPRVVCNALLKPVGSDKFFRFVDTHLDHISPETREKELAILAGWLPTDGTPAVLTGDFNAMPESGEIQPFLQFLAKNGWSDASRDLGGTFHDYGRCQPAEKIDYIFTNCKFSGSHVPTEPEGDGVYYSDHYVVVTDLTV